MNPPAFILDYSSLKNMLEGKKSGSELLEKLIEMKAKGKEIEAFTPLSSFLRAIHLADKNIKIEVLQKVISIITIVPSFADFNNEEEVLKEIIIIAKKFSGENKNV
jgi:predicted CopG family antitoxin